MKLHILYMTSTVRTCSYCNVLYHQEGFPPTHIYTAVTHTTCTWHMIHDTCTVCTTCIVTRFKHWTFDKKFGEMFNIEYWICNRVQISVHLLIFSSHPHTLSICSLVRSLLVRHTSASLLYPFNDRCCAFPWLLRVLISLLMERFIHST